MTKECALVRPPCAVLPASPGYPNPTHRLEGPEFRRCPLLSPRRSGTYTMTPRPIGGPTRYRIHNPAYAHPDRSRWTSGRLHVGASGSGCFADGHGEALPQLAHGAVDRCRLGGMVGIQHAPDFALSDIEVAG